jgi:transcriptional regulator with XRE-family HTH domain
MPHFDIHVAYNKHQQNEKQGLAMARNVRTHLPNDAPSDRTFAPKHLTKQEFGRRLYSMLLAKGWNQSEMARRSGLPRDSISVYVRGKSLPTPASLKALSEALDVPPEELLPNHIESAIDEDNPSLEIKTSVGAPNLAWVRMNRAVSLKTALRIAEMLEADGAATADGK